MQYSSPHLYSPLDLRLPLIPKFSNEHYYVSNGFDAEGQPFHSGCQTTIGDSFLRIFPPKCSFAPMTLVVGNYIFLNAPCYKGSQEGNCTLGLLLRHRMADTIKIRSGEIFNLRASSPLHLPSTMSASHNTTSNSILPHFLPPIHPFDKPIPSDY